MKKILSVFLVPVFALLFSLNAKSESLTLGWAAWDPANACLLYTSDAADE